MNVENRIARIVEASISELSGQVIKPGQVVLQRTRKDFEGDLTLVVFPFVKLMRRSPEDTARFIGELLVERLDEVEQYNVVKGFLNLSLSNDYWLGFIRERTNDPDFGLEKPDASSGSTHEGPVVVEFSSPNTNKPLHLGHVRNNLLGYSVSCLLQGAGREVVKVNLVNDRGIHICKSMLAWMRFGNGTTPESSGKKGDKLVGDYYVLFERKLRAQVSELMENSLLSEEDARKQAPLMKEAQELLQRWESGDPEVVNVWKQMNGWVYEGFDATYRRMGVDFDKIYYESDTYLLGKKTVLEGLQQKALYRKEDGSVWADLQSEKLDDKLLLRADGTSVYMTQDIGTAQLRYDDFHPERMVYVVGNEQNHHFNVLKKVLHKLDKPYADAIYHLSYGMVELPEGKMKSREGTVVDADDLMDEMEATARRMTEE
ncbi:MAG: arginine--tRNA ligase, partial [Bacteroidales bacterium]